MGGFAPNVSVIKSAALKPTPSFYRSNLKHLDAKREELIKQGVLKEEKERGVYRFSRDCLFNSPSIVASIVLGANVNRLKEWKYGEQSLGELRKQ